MDTIEQLEKNLARMKEEAENAARKKAQAEG